MAAGDLVQSAEASADGATTCAVTIAAATAGNLLVGFHFTGAQVSSGPSGFSEAVALTDGGQVDEGAIYYKIAAGGETSLSFGSSSSDEHMCIVVELEGPWESTPLDKTASNDATDSETTTSSGTTATTSQADEVACAMTTVRAASPGFTGWSNSFTEIDVSIASFKGMGAAYKVLSATGAQETTSTHTSARCMGGIATFKLAAGGGANPKGPFGLPLHGPLGGPI